MRKTTNNQNKLKIYPCDRCGVMRSKDEGGTIFTVCDDCWDKTYKKKKVKNEGTPKR